MREGRSRLSPWRFGARLQPRCAWCPYSTTPCRRMMTGEVRTLIAHRTKSVVSGTAQPAREVMHSLANRFCGQLAVSDSSAGTRDAVEERLIKRRRCELAIGLRRVSKADLYRGSVGYPRRPHAWSLQVKEGGPLQYFRCAG